MAYAEEHRSQHPILKDIITSSRQRQRQRVTMRVLGANNNAAHHHHRDRGRNRSMRTTPNLHTFSISITEDYDVR